MNDATARVAEPTFKSPLARIRRGRLHRRGDHKASWSAVTSGLPSLARRVFRLRILAVKKSKKRSAAFGFGRNTAGGVRSDLSQAARNVKRNESAGHFLILMISPSSKSSC